MNQGPLFKAIEQVLSLLLEDSTQCLATGIDDADLIIFDDVRKIEADYSRNKRYGYLNTQCRNLVMPDNVTVLSTTECVEGLLKLVTDVQTTMPAEIPQTKRAGQRQHVPTLPDARTILVVDDTETHRDSAYELLSGHHLTVCKGYEEAMIALERSAFEVVLTDLHMPMCSRTMGDKFRLGELVPYGLLIALEAARRDSSRVAVVTDINHHNDPISAAFDHFSRFEFAVEKARVTMHHARFTTGGGKNWKLHMDELLTGS
ncbi:MAG TPA: hypothetical protein VF438_03655 [Candidatus Paceibacterota bacterium]